MKYWRSVSLGDAITAATPCAEIADRFRRLYPGPQRSADAAVFTRIESEGRLHCEVIAYFSPGAADVATLFEAQPCVKPERDGLSLLAGADDAWSALFI